MANQARVTQSAVEAITLLQGNGLVTQSVVELIVGLGIICNNPPAGDVGTPYSHAFPAGSGTPPYSWSIIAGTLPPGLVLNGSTGVLSGVPAVPGFFSFTIQVQDALTTTASVTCSITVTGGIDVTITLYGYKLFPTGRCGDDELVAPELPGPVKRVL